MKKNVSKLTDLLALAVFAAFAVCVLIVLLCGARSYNALVQRGEENFRQRTAAQYVATRVRQAENLTVTDFGGCDALTISEQIGGEVYLTRVYCCGGYLRELFCAADADLSPGDGEKIIEAGSLCLSVDGDLLTASVDGVPILLQLRTEREVCP